MRMGVIVVGTCVLLAAGCGSTKHATPPSPKPTPPVIREASFTLLPCPNKHAESTIALEGCAEHEIVTTDRKINTQAAAIFKLLRPDARAGFTRSERSWLAYRNGDCEADSSGFAGGTGEPVEFAFCVADENRDHLHRLTELRKFLEPH